MKHKSKAISDNVDFTYLGEIKALDSKIFFKKIKLAQNILLNLEKRKIVVVNFGSSFIFYDLARIYNSYFFNVRII